MSPCTLTADCKCDAAAESSASPHHSPSSSSSSSTSTTTTTSSSSSLSGAHARFFAYMCLSIVLRSFEAGIVSSMMSEIQSTLRFGYASEGSVAASPDYGIAPGSILAIFVFRRFRDNAKSVLVFVSFGTALSALACAYRPSLNSLLAARAMGGMLWAHACTHYPVWIDRHGPPEKRTLWLGGINVSILAGTLGGYVVGGAARTGGSGLTWVDLYWLEGIMMTGCGLLLVLCFDPELVRIIGHQESLDGRGTGSISGSISSSRGPLPKGTKLEPSRGPLRGSHVFESGQSSTSYDSCMPRNDHVGPSLAPSRYRSGNQGDCLTNGRIAQDGDKAPDESLLPIVLSLFRSTPFVLSVVLSACIAGCIVFNLYFVTQYIVARGLGEQEALLAVSCVFITSPGPGTLMGAWIVERMGGYDDHVSTFGFALASGFAALASCLVFPLSRIVAVDVSLDGPYSQSSRLMLVVACWLFFFTGGSSAAPLNGIAVSAVPRASHVASCIQFALQNAAKIVVPQLGGYVVYEIGLLDGFDLTTIASVVVFIALAAFGLEHAMREQRKGRRREDYEEILV